LGNLGGSIFTFYGGSHMLNTAEPSRVVQARQDESLDDLLELVKELSAIKTRLEIVKLSLIKLDTK
jgi:hypothetical protein